MTRIFLSPPDVRPLERAMVDAAIVSNWVAPVGPDLDEFERAGATAGGVQYAVGLSSGTAALHLALKELGVGAGDSVLCSTFTFIATANAATYVGATPVFIDSDVDTWTMSVSLVADELAQRARTGNLPKAAVIVDLYGQCADYDELLPLFATYGVPVIEDAAEALGSTYRGRPAGSFGTCGVLSFNGNKIITTSGGGMLLCDDRRLADRVRYLATQAREPFAHYEHVEVGYNYRLSNVLAAFGRGQLAALPERISRRRAINERYRQQLGAVPGVGFMPIAQYGESNCWLSCVLLDVSITGIDPESLRLQLEAADIESRPTWKPMHLQPVYRDAPACIDGTSEQLFRRGLCLPSGSGMTDAQQDFVIDRTLAALHGS